MHAGEQLVDHLEGGALARLVAELVELGRHRIERGPRLSERRRAPGGENGQRSLRGALRPAADRRIEIEATLGLEPLCQTTGHSRIHGGGGDEDGPLGHGLRDPLLAEQDGLGLSRIDHHRDDHIGANHGLSRCGRAAPTLGHEPLDGGGADVAARDLETRALERERRAETHRAQADHGGAAGRRPGAGQVGDGVRHEAILPRGSRSDGPF